MKPLLILGAINGFLAVLIGAFGAHGLRSRLLGLPDGMRRLEWWETGARYHLAHALAIVLVAALFDRLRPSIAVASAWSFAAGILLFSGSLYALSLSGVRALGAVTPFGGLAFLVGWAALLVAAVRA